MTAITETSERVGAGIRAVVRERVESSPGMSYADLADLLIEEGIAGESVDYVLRFGLIALIKVIRADRRRAPGEQHRGDPNRSVRWENVARVHAENHDVFQREFWSPSGQQMLGDFGKADVRWAHAAYRKLADGNARRAQWFADLDRILPEGRLVHSLPREQVEAIFDV